MQIPTIAIVETSMPTDGRVGTAKVKVSGQGVSVTTSIFLAPDDNDRLEKAIRQWQRAVEPETESSEICEGVTP